MRTRRAIGIVLKADLCSSEQLSKFIVESGVASHVSLQMNMCGPRAWRVPSNLLKCCFT